MHSWLETPDHFNELHIGLLLEMRKWLVPRLPAGFRTHIATRSPLHWLLNTNPPATPDDAHRVTARFLRSTLDVDTPLPRPHRFVEIRGGHGRLLTTVELLRPEHKSTAGAERFQRRQEALYRSGVSLVEIDLLRAGSYRHGSPRKSYTVTTLDAHRGTTVHQYADSGEPLPTIRIPLPAPHGTLPLDLETLLQEYLDLSGTGLWLARQVVRGN